jgi:calcineurin-like phosphoesterase family protein
MAFARKFYIADTHFGHRLMIGDSLARPRPFASTDEMDEALIANWNAVVGPDDIVFHLGDFAFQLHDRAERVRGIFHRLNGRKRLVIGNHDQRKDGSLHPTLAGLPWDEEPRDIVQTADDGVRLVLCHYALRTWPGIMKGAWHFYGHSHGGLPGEGRSRDVGVDCPDTGFVPRTFRELTSHIGVDNER